MRRPRALRRPSRRRAAGGAGARRLLALSLVLGLGCASGGPPPGGDAARCRPHFPYADGWLGGDAAASVDLESVGAPPRRDHTLWLFGDTFVGSPDARDRVGSRFIHNSVAISHCGPGGFEIEYAWGIDEAGEPAAFLAPPAQPANRGADAGAYWWLFNGFVHDGALYIGLLEITPSPPRGPLALPFRMTGMHLARVADPSTPPQAWSAQVARLSRSQHGFPAASMLVHGGFVFFFSFTPLQAGRQHRFLARLPIDSLGRWDSDLSDELETLVDDGTWQPGFLPSKARVLMADNGTEMSVEFVPELGRWLAVYGAPIQVDEADSATLSDTVYARTASDLAGPWSERWPLYRIPEMRDPADPGTLCYAGRSHQRFAPEARLFVTYVCNLYAPPGTDPYPVIERLQRNMELYRPVGVLLPLSADRDRSRPADR
jgi:hypothetical protein